MRSTLILLVAATTLAACGKTGPDAVDKMDKDLVANATDDSDPALTSALEDQIMVDPKLAQQSNAKTVKPAPAPEQAMIPPGENGAAPVKTNPADTQLGSVAGVKTGDCRDVRAGLDWAKRLPAQFPLPPGAAVAEAAGSDRNGCTLRIVSFTTPDPVDKLFGFYADRARAAGYSVDREAQGGDQVLGGVKGDAAYSVMARPAKGGGTSADLMVNGGR